MASLGESFLAGDQVNPSWNRILNTTPLQLRIERGSGQPGQPGNISIISPALWNLRFSSNRNGDQFGPLAGSSTEPSTGENEKDMVFGLVAPATPPTNPLLFVDARRIFGITTTTSLDSQLTQFLTLVDPDLGDPVPLVLDGAGRNALWTLSGIVNRTIAILSFKLPINTLVSIEDFISNVYGVRVGLEQSEPHLMLQIITIYGNPINPSLIQPSSIYEMTVEVLLNGFVLSLAFTPTGLSARLSNPSPASSTGWLERLNAAILGPSGFSLSGMPNILSGVKFWYLDLDRDFVPSGAVGADDTEPTMVPGPLSWRITLIANWTSNTVVTLQYDSRTTTFSGRLLFDHETTVPHARRLYYYDPGVDLSRALPNTTLPESLNLWRLFPVPIAAPPQIPSSVASVGLSFTPDASGFSVAFDMLVVKDFAFVDTATHQNAAPSTFSWDMISVYALVEHSTTDTLTLDLSSEMSLNPRLGVNIPPATLLVNVSYSTGGSWILRGHASDLSFPLLYHYLAPSVQNTATSMLSSLVLKTLEVFYVHNSAGQATSFFIGGTILLGKLKLDLSYEYTSGLLGQLDPTEQSAMEIMQAGGVDVPSNTPRPTPGAGEQWTFTASLGTNSPSSDLGGIIKAISGNHIVLPSWIGGIQVNDESNSANAAVQLQLRGAGSFTIMTISITLGHLNATLVRLQEAGEGRKPKTILRIALDQIPLAEDIDIVKDLPQPFDRLLYMWVEDETGFGVNQVELQAINDELPELNVPNIEAKGSTNDPSLAVIRAGHHFMVVDKGRVILDHVFGDEDARHAESSQNPAEPPQPQPSTPGGPSGAVAPTKGSIDKQLPLLSISAVSLLFKNGVLGVQLDATVKMGPITFSLLQFELGVELASIKLNDLSKVKPKADIHGLAIALNSPPVNVAGVFIKDITPGAKRFRGGVSLSFQTWKFLAVGEYAILSVPDHPELGSYKSVFIYAKLNGPLLTLAFATVSGVRLGLGYNSSVRTPEIEELPRFPFLSNTVEGGSGDDPSAVIMAMTRPSNSGKPAWVTPQDGGYWVAAGLTLTAFGVLSVTAVLMFQMRTGGFIIAVFANGIAQIPCTAKPEVTLFYVEVGMLAVINTVEGYFTVQAALAPSSHVLVPSCRLTGGFALMNWFAPSPYSGDFVFTVGGYHRAFTPPRWYPKVERVGVSFTVGDMINVSGGVYFAITPKCVMGGGFLHMGLDVGPVSAWLDVSLDVFIQFKPFHYMADMMVSVGCAISIKVWFVHVRIKASVGASLHIEGPEPFGGVANVDFYLFSFTIRFGGNLITPQPARLDEFYQMVLTPGPERPASATDPIDPMMYRLKYTLDKGLIPPTASTPPTPSPPGSTFPDSGPSSGWRVKPGTLRFTISTDFALSSASIIQRTEPGFEDEDPPIPISAPQGGGTTSISTEFYSKPMHQVQPFTSDLKITIWYLDPRNASNPVVVNGFEGVMVAKDVPKALWGQYNAAEDPAVTPRPGELTDPSRPTMRLCMGVTLNMPNPPWLRVSSRLLPFDPTKAFRLSLGTFAIAPAEPINTSFLASGELWPSESGRERWGIFRGEWMEAVEANKEDVGITAEDGTQSEGILKMASFWLGWDNPPPSGNRPVEEVLEGKRKGWQLAGGLPGELVKGMGVEYDVLPRVCGGA